MAANPHPNAQQQCARCGATLARPGAECKVCGGTVNMGVMQPAAEDRKDDPQQAASAFRKEAKPMKPAFLFNKLSNERFPLNQSVSKIGRDQTNNISVTNDHYISRHHAWVLQMQGAYWVEDLGSTNGTLLNGEILSERRQISPGDRLTFGKTEFVFVVE